MKFPFDSNDWLICKPEHFDVLYKINPWMDPSVRPPKERTAAQWSGFEKALLDLGVQLHYVTQTAGQPDMVYTANAGLIKGATAILTTFKYKERQGEEAGFRSFFEEFGYRVVTVGELSFEGEGDALFSRPEVLFGGYGFRTDRAALDKVGEIFNLKIVVPCELVDPRFYHLDTCFAPVSESSAIFFPEAFTKQSIKAMEREIELLPIPSEDALRFACNCVVVGDHIVLPSKCGATEAILKSKGRTPHPVEIDEFFKGGGATKCLSLRLDKIAER